MWGRVRSGRGNWSWTEPERNGQGCGDKDMAKRNQDGRSVSWGPDEQGKGPEMGTAAMVTGWWLSDHSGCELWIADAEMLLYGGSLGPRSHRVP